MWAPFRALVGLCSHKGGGLGCAVWFIGGVWTVLGQRVYLVGLGAGLIGLDLEKTLGVFFTGHCALFLRVSCLSAEWNRSANLFRKIQHDPWTHRQIY